MQSLAISALSRRLSQRVSLPFFNSSYKKGVVKESVPAVQSRPPPKGLDALVKETNFSRQELKIIYRGFKQECPTGVVTEEAFKEIFSQFFPGGDSDSYAHYVFNVIDDDHDGAVSFEDFIRGFSKLMRGDEDEKLLWIFSLYDVNGDGSINRQDMLQIVSAIYSLIGHDVQPPIRKSTIRAHVDYIFQKMDRNEDGVITFDEFMETCKSDESISRSLRCFEL